MPKNQTTNEELKPMTWRKVNMDVYPETFSNQTNDRVHIVVHFLKVVFTLISSPSSSPIILFFPFPNAEFNSLIH
jgi:hypothetical protein